MSKKMSLAQTFQLSALAALLSVSAAHGQLNDKKTLTAVMEADVRVLDPSFSTVYITRTFGFMVFDTLLAQGEDGSIKPQMLESFDVSADKMNYKFVLRDGLKFHDGSKVTAADVVASLQRWGQRDVLGKGLLAATKSLMATDEKTVVLTLAKPDGQVLQTLGKPSALVPFIMPARLAKTPVAEQIPEIIGSGPFVFKRSEWKPGSQMTFERFKDYVPRKEPADFMAGGKVAKVERVVWKVIPDANTAISALQAGEVDYVQYPSFDMLKLLQKDPNVQLVSAKGAGMFQGHFRLNHLEKPFDDPAIRRVVTAAVDQAKFLAALGVPPEFAVNNCLAYFSCGGLYATNAGAESIGPRGIAAAKAALAKTKYKNEKITILQATDIEAPRVSGEVLAQTLREVGFNVALQSMDWGTVASKRASKTGWNIFAVHTLGYDMASPLTNLYTANNCSDFVGWSCDERMTKKLTELRASSDLAKQKDIAVEIQKLVYETTPSVVWGQFAQPAALSKELKGMVHSAIPVFWNVSK